MALWLRSIFHVETGRLTRLASLGRGIALSVSEQSNSRPSRAKLIWAGVVVVLLGAIALDTTVVRIGSDQDVRKQVFNPDAFGELQFSRIRDNVTERAVNAPQLASELAANKKAAMETYGTPSSIGAYMPVRLTGVVAEGKSGVFNVTVEGLPEGTKIRVQTGPAINGTELRDITGDIEFGAFKNQIEYQDAGSGINRAMSADVLADLDRDDLTGKTINVVGVFNLINPKNWLITPVALTVE